jgi:hypothetical protein
MARYLVEIPELLPATDPAALVMIERSAYYWWWQYLRRNRDYITCCEHPAGSDLEWLYFDFGDVRIDDFASWWQRFGEELFAERPALEGFARLRRPRDWKPEYDTYPYAVVAFDVSVGISAAKEQLAAFMSSQYDKPPGRPPLHVRRSTAKYVLSQNINQHVLRDMLMVYDRCQLREQQPRAQQPSLWQIGEELNLMRTAMPKPGDKPKDLADKRNKMSNKVSRYRENATRIIANTAFGRFPDSSKPKAGTN